MNSLNPNKINVFSTPKTHDFLAEFFADPSPLPAFDYAKGVDVAVGKDYTAVMLAGFGIPKAYLDETPKDAGRVPPSVLFGEKKKDACQDYGDAMFGAYSTAATLKLYDELKKLAKAYEFKTHGGK